MQQYKGLLDYISFFEEERKEYGDWHNPKRNLAYVDYEKKISKFTFDVSESDIMEHTILAILNTRTHRYLWRILNQPKWICRRRCLLTI